MDYLPRSHVSLCVTWWFIKWKGCLVKSALPNLIGRRKKCMHFFYSYFGHCIYFQTIEIFRGLCTCSGTQAPFNCAGSNQSAWHRESIQLIQSSTTPFKGGECCHVVKPTSCLSAVVLSVCCSHIATRFGTAEAIVHNNIFATLFLNGQSTVYI